MSALPPQGIFRRSSLLPFQAKQKQTLRAWSGQPFAQRATSRASSAPAGTAPFYNRASELAEFRNKFNQAPGRVTVLLGPPNCGKTRFLQELAEQFKAEEDGPLFLYIDSRITPVDGPEGISKALCDAVTSEDVLLRLAEFADYLKTVLVSTAAEVKTPVGDLSVKLAEFFGKDEENLATTLKKLKGLFTALKSLPRKPVVVIDEANILMQWVEGDKISEPQLKLLLNFFVSISKQANLVHVILATSDYFLINWLAGKGLTTDKFKVQVLGDLTEEEAQKFFFGDGVNGTWAGIINVPSGETPVPSGAGDHWPAIYERFGGNIMLLKDCVGDAREVGDWGAALDSVMTNPKSTIENAFSPKRDGKPPLWTEDQWEIVLRRITTAPHHAVLQTELEKELEKTRGWWPWRSERDGEKIILSMVKCNLLALRPFATLARDLPPEVHGEDKEVVVTLPLPVHVWAAKRLLRKRDRE